MPPQPQLTVPMWLNLSHDVRQQLKEIFSIPRSEGSHIQDNEIISDGHTNSDLAHITVERMQKYVGSKEKDFFILFSDVLGKLPKPVAPEPAKVADPEVKITVEMAGKKFGMVEEKVKVPVVPSDKPEKLKTTKSKKK